MAFSFYGGISALCCHRLLSLKNTDINPIIVFLSSQTGSGELHDTFCMPWDNSVNNNAVIYAAHTTFGVRNMPLIIFTKPMVSRILVFSIPVQ